MIVPLLNIKLKVWVEIATIRKERSGDKLSGKAQLSRIPVIYCLIFQNSFNNFASFIFFMANLKANVKIYIKSCIYYKVRHFYGVYIVFYDVSSGRQLHSLNTKCALCIQIREYCVFYILQDLFFSNVYVCDSLCVYS